MLLRTELEGRTHLITLIRLLLSDYYYPGCDWNSDPKIRPVVHEKQLSGSQIRISIRITPNFELRLPMIITSLLTKFRQNPTSSLWEILLTNKQTNRQTDTRRWLQYPAFRGIIIQLTTEGFLSFWLGWIVWYSLFLALFFRFVVFMRFYVLYLYLMSYVN